MAALPGQKPRLLTSRVSLTGNRVRQMRDPTGMRRRPSAGETRYREIKAAPEKMHRTALSTKTRAEFLKHTIALHENAPESIRVFRVVGMVLFILIQRNRILNLVRHGVDSHGQIEILESSHQRPVKVCN